MLNDIIVLDDFVPKQYCDLIERDILSPRVPWHYMRDITWDEYDIEKYNITTLMPAFAHKYFKEGEGVVSPGYGLVLPVLYLACEKIGYNIKEILAVRSFLTMPIPHLDMLIDHPHIDRAQNCINMIYYVNDSDGDTVFFNETSDDVHPDNLKTLKVSDLTIVKRVTPKKGRAVLFNGNIFHSGSRPTSGHRCIVNYGLL
jgi:hypothetical protein